MTATTTDDKPSWLNADQQARAEALGIARRVLTSGGGPFTKGTLPFDVPEIVDVAVYVVDGSHPMDRYEDDADEGHHTREHR